MDATSPVRYSTDYPHQDGTDPTTVA